MTTPTDPIPEFKLATDRYARREPIAAREAASQELDAETLEVVETFEALYAELSSSEAAPAASARADLDSDDDLLIDLPPEFASPALSSIAVASRGAPSAGQLVHETPRPARAQAAAAQVDPALDIDDAFAMLHAAESKGRENAQRDAIDREEAESAATALMPAHRSGRRRETQSAYEPSAAAPEWAGKARSMWRKVTGAAVIALMVGAGVGYVVGRTPDPVASQAKIPLTPQGGAQLQFDYELNNK